MANTLIELARQYRLAVEQRAYDAVYAIECQLDQRDAELAALRAQLAQAQPLLDAAVQNWIHDSDETDAALFRVAYEYGASAITSRANAQAASAAKE